MLNKAIFKPFFSNVYFTRGEQNNTNIVFTHLKDESKLRIELMSLKGLYLSHEYDVEDTDIEEGTKDTLVTSYVDFVICFSKIKARSAITLSFQDTYLLVKEHLVIKNDEPTIVANMLREVPNIAMDSINVITMSDEMYLDTNDFKNIRYLNALKLDVDSIQQFSKITVKKFNDDLVFIGTSGSALHVAKVKSGEIIDGMNDYSLEPVYLKNISNIDSEYGIYLSVGVNKDNDAVIRFSTDNTILQFIAYEYHSDTSIYDSDLLNAIKLIELEDKQRFNSNIFYDYSYFEGFITMEKEIRSKYKNSISKLTTLLTFNKTSNKNVYFGSIMVNDESFHDDFYLEINNTKEDKYTISCYDLIHMLKDTNLDVCFSENDEYFTLSNENRYIIIPKTM